MKRLIKTATLRVRRGGDVEHPFKLDIQYALGPIDLVGTCVVTSPSFAE